MTAPGSHPLSKPNATPLPAGMLAAEGTSVRLQIEYPDQPKYWRVASVVVRAEWPAGGVAPLPSALGSLNLRLTAPGCQVVPDVATLNLSQATTVAFHLTPLATGPLPPATLEVARATQTLQRIPIRFNASRPWLGRTLPIAAVLLPLAWWWLTGADASALAQSVADKVPPGPWATSTATAVRRVVDAMTNVERTFRVGFLFALILSGAAAFVAFANRERRRTISSLPLALMAGPSPSGRGRGVPAYLTPVPPEELSQVSL